MNKSRKLERIESCRFTEENILPVFQSEAREEINRAHRDCERECLQLKLMLARCADVIKGMNEDIKSEWGSGDVDRLIAELNAILPATEIHNHDA